MKRFVTTFAVMATLCLTVLRSAASPKLNLEVSSVVGAAALGRTIVDIAAKKNISAAQLVTQNWQAPIMEQFPEYPDPRDTGQEYPWYDKFGSSYCAVASTSLPGGWAMISWGRDGVPGGSKCDDLVLTGDMLESGDYSSVWNIYISRREFGKALLCAGAGMLFAASFNSQSRRALVCIALVMLVIGAWAATEFYRTLYHYPNLFVDSVTSIMVGGITALIVSSPRSIRPSASS